MKTKRRNMKDRASEFPVFQSRFPSELLRAGLAVSVLAASLFGSSPALAQAAGAALTAKVAASTSGFVITFTTTVTNTGSVTLTSVSAQNSLDSTGQMIRCGTGNLPSGTSCQSVFKFTAPGPGTYPDTVTVRTFETGPVTVGAGGSGGTGGSGSSAPGLTPVEAQIANSLEHACAALAELKSLTPAQSDLLAQCLALTSATSHNSSSVASSLNELAPETALLQTNASILVTTAQFNNIDARLAALRSGSGSDHFGGLAFATPDGTLPVGSLGNAALGFDDKPAGTQQEVGGGFDRLGYFVTGSFGNGSAAQLQSTPGYGFHSDGLTAGVDYRINDHLIFGVSAGYARYSSAVDNVGGGMDTHGWSFSAYSTFYRKDNWYVDGVLSYGSNSYGVDRRIVYTLPTPAGMDLVDETATSTSSGNTLAGAITVGRDYSQGAWSFGPYLRGNWGRSDFGGYQENIVSGMPGSGLGLAVDSREMSDVSSVLGVKINYAMSESWGVLMPHAEWEWQHDFQDNPDSINARFLQDPTATSFKLTGDPIDKDFGRLGLGLSFQFTHGRSGFIYFEKTLRLQGITQNDLSIGFRMEF